MVLRRGCLIVCFMIVADAYRTVHRDVTRESSAARAVPRLAPHNQTLGVADTFTKGTALAEVASEGDRSHRQSHDSDDGVSRVGFVDRDVHIVKRVAQIEELTAVAVTTSLDTKEKLAKSLGVVAGDSCQTEGQASNIGCKIGCQCHRGKECYPSTVFVRNGKSDESVGEHFDVGVCQQSMLTIILMCIVCFFGLLGCVVMLRAAVIGSIHEDLLQPPLPPLPASSGGGKWLGGSTDDVENGVAEKHGGVEESRRAMKGGTRSKHKAEVFI